MFVQNLKATKNVRQTTLNQSLQTFSSSVLYTGLSITFVFCTFATIIVIYSFLASCLSAGSDTSFQPTSIPWLESQSPCERTGRIWHQKQCWDKEHSPMF